MNSNWIFKSFIIRSSNNSKFIKPTATITKSNFASYTHVANIVQENCDFIYRGRVLGVYLSCFTAGTTFGVLLVGFEAQTFGARFPLYIGAFISMFLAVVILRYKNKIRYRLQF